VFGALSYAPGRAWPLWLYDHVPGVRPVTELGYRLIAGNRSLLHGPTRLVFGSQLVPRSTGLVTSLFLRLFGLIYPIAFVSFWTQQSGLIRSDGILPVGGFLEAVRDAIGTEAYWRVPTLFWIDSGDMALTLVAGAGVVFALLLMAGLAQRTSLVFLYVLYLSIKSGGQVFTFYQWDALLLEVGFLAVFLTLTGSAVVYLFRALLFRFMFLAGAAKLLSGDPTWRDLTALSFHDETQPLPMWIGWYVHQLLQPAGDNHVPAAARRYAGGSLAA
jgi:hypothetical protein